MGVGGFGGEGGGGKKSRGFQGNGVGISRR